MANESATGLVPEKIQAAPEPPPRLIDLGRTLTVVLTYPDDTVPMELAWWFLRLGFHHNKIAKKNKKGEHDDIRNEVLLGVEPVLEKLDWIIFLDNDIRPNITTDMFLFDRPDADVVACNYTDPVSTLLPESFHMGIVRVRTETLRKVIELSAKDGQPAFLKTWTPDHTKVLECECGWFRKRLQVVGARIVRVGLCGHSKSVNIV